MPDFPSSTPIKKSSPTNVNDIAMKPNSIKLRLFFLNQVWLTQQKQ